MRPALMLIPGMLNDASVWDGVLARLGALAEIRIAAPVQPSIAEMAQAAWAQLSDLPPQQPAVLAGFSLGGYVAIEMLARPACGAPRVQGLALVSTSARPEAPEGAAARAKTIQAMQRDFGKVVDDIAQWNLHEPSPERVAGLRRMMLAVGPEVAVRQLRAIAARADHRDALARLDMPVAVLCGRQDRTTPPALAQEIGALVPHAMCDIVEGASHMLPIEQPQAVAAALRSLLQ